MDYSLKIAFFQTNGPLIEQVSNPVSNPSLLNLILIKFNSKVAHGRSHCTTTKFRIHTKYRSLLGKVTENSENNITAINYEFRHGIFFTV